jgi:serine/threonine protein kinase
MHTTPPMAASGDSSPTQPDLTVLAARYEVLGEVGRGGMGVVYQARHRNLDVRVAVKVLLPGAPTDRFLREARLLARIKSPHVIAVHDFDVLPDGSPMLVMEWVEGTDLARVLKARAGPLPEEQGLAWMRQACAGMAAAAEQGIIHRDLKPSNLLLDGHGTLRVADFGLARGPADNSDLTFGGGPMGTPYYMAPEQAEDPRSVDTRADVYSFGATFYHALTGQPPFDGESPFVVMYKHKMEPLVSPAARNPRLSARTSEVLERCLAKAPNDRFPSFAEVLPQLQPAASGTSPWDTSEDPRLAPYLDRFHARRDVYLRRRHRLTEPDVYAFPGDRALQLVVGDIVQQKVEVLVSSDDEDLTMGTTDQGVRGVAKALLRAGGPEILRETLRYVPARPGRAVVTSAGTLPARFIFHGITLGASRDPRVRPSRDLISEILASCFYHADTFHVRTIAFPLLGTGKGGFAEDVCLETMFRYLCRTLLRGLTSVREARIVLYPKARPRKPA